MIQNITQNIAHNMVGQSYSLDKILVGQKYSWGKIYSHFTSKYIKGTTLIGGDFRYVIH